MNFNNLILVSLIITGITLVSSCSPTISEQSISIIIGEQEWMTKNLDVGNFRNGDSIPEFKTNEDWENAANKELPAWCYYENDPIKGAKSGKLYNRYAVNDPRGLAPEGWHIPSREEWTEIEKKLDGKKSLFSGNLGGFRHLAGNCRMYGKVGYWGSSTETDAKITSWVRQFSDNILEESNTGKGTGFSIRCIRDKTDILSTPKNKPH